MEEVEELEGAPTAPTAAPVVAAGPVELQELEGAAQVTSSPDAGSSPRGPRAAVCATVDSVPRPRPSGPEVRHSEWIEIREICGYQALLVVLFNLPGRVGLAAVTEAEKFRRLPAATAWKFQCSLLTPLRRQQRVSRQPAIGRVCLAVGMRLLNRRVFLFNEQSIFRCWSTTERAGERCWDQLGIAGFFLSRKCRARGGMLGSLALRTGRAGCQSESSFRCRCTRAPTHWARA
jgi:hypothetical protein